MCWFAWLLCQSLACEFQDRTGVESKIGRLFSFSRKRSEHRLLILDGFRALSLLWIVLGHTVATAHSIGFLNAAIFDGKIHIMSFVEWLECLI